MSLGGVRCEDGEEEGRGRRRGPTLLKESALFVGFCASRGQARHTLPDSRSANTSAPHTLPITRPSRHFFSQVPNTHARTHARTRAYLPLLYIYAPPSKRSGRSYSGRGPSFCTWFGTAATWPWGTCGSSPRRSAPPTSTGMSYCVVLDMFALLWRVELRYLARHTFAPTLAGMSYF